MTTRVEAKDILLKEFISSYDLPYPVAYANNDNFTKPTTTPWIKFDIVNNNSRQVSFAVEGNRKFRRFGIISYQVYIPINTGTYDGGTICEAINDIFEGKRFEDIYCETGSWSEIGVTEDDLFMFQGTIYFNFDEIK